MFFAVQIFVAKRCSVLYFFSTLLRVVMHGFDVTGLAPENQRSGSISIQSRYCARACWMYSIHIRDLEWRRSQGKLKHDPANFMLARRGNSMNEAYAEH
jgi:hypothetical protein